MKQLAALKPAPARNELYLTDYSSTYQAQLLIKESKLARLRVDKPLIQDYPYAHLVEQAPRRTILNAQANVWYPSYPTLNKGQLPASLEVRLMRADVTYCLADNNLFRSRLESCACRYDVPIVFSTLTELERVVKQKYQQKTHVNK